MRLLLTLLFSLSFAWGEPSAPPPSPQVQKSPQSTEPAKKTPAQVPKVQTPNIQVVRLDAYPSSISLTSNKDFNSFVLVATYDNGVTRDVTGQSNFVLSDPNIASIKDHLLLPKSDGNTKLQASYQGLNTEISITVSKAKENREVSFNLDVMPVFLKAGCNTGSCHGSARGQDRFMLSLFGYDPEGDHYRITREQGTRRINLAIPEESMLVEKSIGAVPHTGGKLFSKDSEHWKTLVNWLKKGALDDPKDIAKPEKLELYPPELLLEGDGASQLMTVLARYTDGTTRDVTKLTVFQSNNELSASINEDGLVTAGKRGEAFIMARFNVFTVGIQAVVIPKNLKYQRPQLPANNYVDSLVHEKLHKLRITQSGLCSDEVFLRRIFLDVVGDTDKIGKALRKDFKAGKATFVSLLGLAGAKKRAHQLVTEACDSIDHLGPKADRLRKLANFVINRAF